MLKAFALLQISMLTMGVGANSTPIYDAPLKQPLKENVVNNYSLEFQQVGNLTQDSFTNVAVQEQILGTDSESKRNLTVESNYINVQATEYKTYTGRTINGQDKIYVLNKEKYDLNEDNIYPNNTRFLTVMQITPYNYNISTETSIYLWIQLNGWTDSNGDQIRIDNEYYVKRVYQTVQDDWSTFLNRQVVSFNARKIEEEITNVNNNFYYTMQQSVINADTDHTDTTEINLQPNKTNYIVIEYMPMAKCSYYDFAEDTWGNFGTQVSTIPLTELYVSQGTYTISGTNIIPGEINYEVIDIPGLMWQILTMPFAFVSQAFNLTLFPGTPYQVNISNLFLSIIAIFVFVWLIGFFIKMKG